MLDSIPQVRLDLRLNTHRALPTQRGCLPTSPKDCHGESPGPSLIVYHAELPEAKPAVMVYHAQQCEDSRFGILPGGRGPVLDHGTSIAQNSCCVKLREGIPGERRSEERLDQASTRANQTRGVLLLAVSNGLHSILGLGQDGGVIYVG